MKHRKLRIGWSVGWGVVAALMVMLWVRSYSHFDFCDLPTSSRTSLHLQSAHGRIVLFALSDFHSLEIGSVTTPHIILAGELTQPMTGITIAGGNYISVLNFDPSRIHIVHFWPVTVVTCVVAAAPWFPWWSSRFSLRTLLVATTLIAVGLGVIGWAVK